MDNSTIDKRVTVRLYDPNSILYIPIEEPLLWPGFYSKSITLKDLKAELRFHPLIKYRYFTFEIAKDNLWISEKLVDSNYELPDSISVRIVPMQSIELITNILTHILSSIYIGIYGDQTKQK